MAHYAKKEHGQLYVTKGFDEAFGDIYKKCSVAEKGHQSKWKKKISVCNTIKHNIKKMKTKKVNTMSTKTPFSRGDHYWPELQMSVGTLR